MRSKRKQNEQNSYLWSKNAEKMPKTTRNGFVMVSIMRLQINELFNFASNVGRWTDSNAIDGFFSNKHPSYPDSRNSWIPQVFYWFCYIFAKSDCCLTQKYFEKKSCCGYRGKNMFLQIDLRAVNVTIDVEGITILLSCFNPMKRRQTRFHASKMLLMFWQDKNERSNQWTPTIDADRPGFWCPDHTKQFLEENGSSETLQI